MKYLQDTCKLSDISYFPSYGYDSNEQEGGNASTRSVRPRFMIFLKFISFLEIQVMFFLLQNTESDVLPP